MFKNYSQLFSEALGALLQKFLTTLFELLKSFLNHQSITTALLYLIYMTEFI